MPLDLTTVISAGALVAGGGGLIAWGVKALVESHLNSTSQRTLAAFKHKLDSSAAAASFDYQRQLQNFNLFVMKKHEAIAQLHELLLDAMSQICGLAQGEHQRPLLLGMHADDVSDYLEHHANIPRGKRAEIMTLWETDQERALVLLYEYQDAMQGEHAQRAWVKANNYKLKHDLYFPEVLSNRVSHFTDKLYRLFLTATAATRTDDFTSRYARQEVVAELDELRTLMKAEMARAEFADVSPRES